jgi:hypothetical protein
MSGVGDVNGFATLTLELADGDTVGAQVYQLSGAAINITAGLYVYKVG